MLSCVWWVSQSLTRSTAYAPPPTTTPPGSLLVRFTIMSTPSLPDPQLPQQAPPAAPNLPAPAGTDGVPAANPSSAGVPQPVPLSPPTPGTASSRPDWSQMPELQDAHLRHFPRRRLTVPLILFVATCLSTFYVGAADWRPQLVGSTAEIWHAVT